MSCLCVSRTGVSEDDIIGLRRVGRQWKKVSCRTSRCNQYISCSNQVPTLRNSARSLGLYAILVAFINSLYYSFRIKWHLRYISWYVYRFPNSGRRIDVDSSPSEYTYVIVFLSCAETTFADAYQPPRTPFVTRGTVLSTSTDRWKKKKLDR